MGSARFRSGSALAGGLAALGAALLAWGAAAAGAHAAGADVQTDAPPPPDAPQPPDAPPPPDASPPPDAQVAAPLERFLNGLRSLRTHFTQIVTGAHGRIMAQSTGELIVLRPGKFRWEIHPNDGNGAGQNAGSTGGTGQLLVADGRNLWFYDADLQQVTVRRESTALTATPAILLSGGANALAAFDVSDAGKKDGLDWVQVVPKAPEADFKVALLGFSGDELERMILDDKLGQRATLNFQDAERNVPVAPSEVSFTPPAGADVIGTPAK
jgi:outer membrane lipoprotein carrier protein